MKGPFTTAFDDTCTKTTSTFRVPHRKGVRCSSLAKKEGAELSVAQSAVPPDIQFYVSLHTKDGWFTAAVPMYSWAYHNKGALYHSLCYESTISSAEISETSLNGRPIWIGKVLLTWKTSSERGHCENTTDLDAMYTETHMILCGINQAGVAICTSPLRSEDGAPVGRLVNGKLQLQSVWKTIRGHVMDYFQLIEAGDYALPF